MTKKNPELTVDSIAAIAERMGLASFTLSKVAKELGVTTPALYRHVKNRAHLEEIVAARLLHGVSLYKECATAHEYLIFLAQVLFRVCDAHPGLGSYMLRRFPADKESQRIANESWACLCALGYSPHAAQILASTTATYAISLTESHQLANGEDAATQCANSGGNELNGNDPLLSMPPLERFTLFILPAIDGLINLIKPNDELIDVITAAKGRLT